MWLEYLKQEWREPNKTDHYLMQIAQEIRRANSKKPNSVKLKNFKIKFGEEKPRSSQEIWFQILGIKADDRTTTS